MNEYLFILNRIYKEYCLTDVTIAYKFQTFERMDGKIEERITLLRRM